MFSEPLGRTMGWEAVDQAMDQVGFQIKAAAGLDVLVDELARDLSRSPLPPVLPETVVVQSGGLRRWLRLELARRHGVAAGLQMPFPAAFFRELAAILLAGEAVGRAGGLTATGPYRREGLAWRLFARFRQDTEGLDTQLTAYLEGDVDGRRAWQLAVRLAGLFDDYQLYRPDLVLAWEAGKELTLNSPTARRHQRWQARLWRGLVAGIEDEASPARRLDALLDTLRQAPPPPGALPPRVALFGVTTLPPRLVDLLVALAAHLPVTLYLATPARGYWGDIRSEREIAARGEEGELHFETGNPLLASLGGQGRDFFNLLTERDPTGEAYSLLTDEAPTASTALGRLQEDVRDLVDRGPGRPEPERWPLAPDDRSLQVHSCWSPRREMEVLRDLLLEAFHDLPDLQPAEVVVLAPDMGLYAPYVEAVFGSVEEGLPALPYRVADRNLREEQPLVDTFLRLLALGRSRLTVNEVLEPLECPALARTFGIGEGDLPVLRHWVRETGIRWGVDGQDRREQFDLPDTDANSWRQGLERLLLGYAAGPEAGAMGGVETWGETTAGRVDLLGGLADYLEALFDLVGALRRGHPPEGWKGVLAGAVDRFFTADGEEEEAARSRLLAHIADLDADTAADLDTLEVTLPVVQERLESSLAGEPGSGAFLDGRVTFCELKPLRSIPFRLVCLVGMGDGLFPRAGVTSPFDLMELGGRRQGDRSVVRDDRYLFLESVLAAGERLLVLWQGHNPVDGSERPPSSCLGELLDQVDRSFEPGPEGRPASQHLVREHPLHPWDRRYYDAADERLFTWSRANARAAGVAATSRETAVPPYLSDPDPQAPQEESELVLTPTDLVDFWTRPVAWWCREIQGFTLPRHQEEEEIAEPFAVDNLERYRIVEELLAARRRSGAGEGEGAVSGPLPPDLDRLRRQGRLPGGELGHAAWLALSDGVEALLARAGPPGPGGAEAVDLSGPGWRLAGKIDGVEGDGRMVCHPGRLSAKVRLEGWIAHLVLAAGRAARGETPPTTTLVGPEDEVRYGAVAEPAETLAALLAGRRAGERRPLPFFPTTSEEYVKKAKRGQVPDPEALELDLSQAWESRWDRGVLQKRGDGDDPYVGLVFRGRHPLRDPEERDLFIRWAETVWLPVLAAVKGGRR